MRNSDILKVANVLRRICKMNNIEVYNAQDTLDFADLNGTSLCINDDEHNRIIIGNFTNLELWLLTLAHEVGHFLCTFQRGLITDPPIEREYLAWMWAIDFLSRNFPRIKFSGNIVELGYYAFLSYESENPKRRIPPNAKRQFNRLVG
jgi:hypothetical protein